MTVSIPVMFDGYYYGVNTKDLTTQPNASWNRAIQIYCSHCKKYHVLAFAAVCTMMGGADANQRRHCPNCGKFLNNWNCQTHGVNQLEPLSGNISLIEHKNMIGLSFKGKGITFGDLSYKKSDYSEIVLFDLENNTTHWKIGKITYRLGNPDDKTFYEKSFFDYLYRNCHLYKEDKTYKQDLDILFKELLTQLSAKMNKLHFSKQSLYTNYGSIEQHGRYLPQIFNIAYRIAFPDCTNLSRNFSNRYEAPSCPSIGKNYQTIKTAIANGADSITAIITAVELPNTKLIRKIVSQSILSIERLKMIFNHIKNYDNAMKIWNANEYSSYQEQELIFLKSLTKIYDETQLVNYYLTKHADFGETKRLYDYNYFSTTQLKKEKVKFSDLHNWCVEKNKLRQEKEELLKTRDPETKFELPPAIIRRLEMQRDIFSFFLPESQAELNFAGNQLHNCLRTYDKEMENKADASAKIVLVADDFGKLVAAVRINNFVITEAKLKYNKSAKTDSEINSKIIQWAKTVKLTINTNDIDENLEFDITKLAA
ncbi:MAG: hypothetical protein WC725_05175 [Patescibacteria group bacterium]|jgi:hypothetical protein